MATTAYEDALRVAQQLTPEERAQLQRDLAAMAHTDSDGSGATFVDALLAAPPLDPMGLDAMEQAIEAGCERIDPRDW